MDPGSRIVTWLNERIFDKPKDFAPTNFRLMRRDVVDFFIVGAQRCGTSLLHGMLSGHPEIEMAMR